MRRGERARVHHLAARGAGVQGVPGGVSHLLGVSGIERQHSGSPNEAHGNDVSAHFEHAYCAPIRLSWDELADDESSRLARMSAGRQATEQRGKKSATAG